VSHYDVFEAWSVAQGLLYFIVFAAATAAKKHQPQKVRAATVIKKAAAKPVTKKGKLQNADFAAYPY
jgi:hypothetical protein